MKRILKTLSVCLLCLGLLANVQAAAKEEEPLYDETVSGWHIILENAMVRQTMKNVTVELGYTDVQTSEYTQEAPEGKAYCLLKLKMEKAGSREAIDWANLLLTDDQEREYHRIDDDFLSELGMKHMPSIKLNFGINEGWIAFEIEEDAEELTLSYPFEEEPFEYTYTLEETQS